MKSMMTIILAVAVVFGVDYNQLMENYFKFEEIYCKLHAIDTLFASLSFGIFIDGTVITFISTPY